MKKLGWKALGYAFCIFVVLQLIPLSLHMMSQASLIKFNLGVILLVAIILSITWSFIKLLLIGRKYLKSLEKTESQDQ